MKKVLVIGSINMDLVIQTEKLPKLGETVYGSNFSVICGGKGANQAVAAARVGCNVEMIGAVGNDAYADILINNLESNNVGTRGVKRVDTNSGVAVITVHDGDNSIILDKGANARVSVDLIKENISLIEEADIVVMQFEIPVETVMFAAKAAHEMGKSVIINPAPYVEFPEELYKYTDIMIPNQYEAIDILKMGIDTREEAVEAVKMLEEKGVKRPVITLGVDGSVFLENKEEGFAPANKVTAVDSTGAGDSFIGGICKGLSEGKELKECMDFASCVSAITVTRFGAAASFPTLEEVNKFIKNR